MRLHNKNLFHNFTFMIKSQNIVNNAWWWHFHNSVTVA